MQVLTRLDLLRARLLKASFQIPWAEELFRTRSLRLLAQFLGALVIATAFALYQPLIPLILGPLIAGPAHLLMSAETTRLRSWWLPLAGLGAVLILTTSLPVVIAMAFGIFALRSSSWPQALLYGLGGGAFALSAFHSLFLAAALAGFVHNFVGFAFWFRESRTNGEKMSCLFSFILLVTMTLAILGGALPVPDHVVLQDLADAFSVFGEPSRVLSAFALGQSIHYFVWLKAIPDQKLRSPIPPSLRVRYRSLETAIGRPMIIVVSFATIGLVGLALINLELARSAYAAAAAAHGWLELAALGLP